MNTRSFIKSQALLGVVAAALAAGGAGSQAQEALKIGGVLSLTGSMSPYGPGQAEAIKIAVDQVNKAGGVLGQPMAAPVEDDETNAASGVNAARKLVDVNGARALVGLLSSSVTLPVLAYTTQVGIPVLTSAGAPQVTDVAIRTGLAFRFVSTEAKFAEGYAILARKAGFKKASVLAFNNAAQTAAAEAFVKRFAKEGGTTSTPVIFEGGKSSYRSELAKVLESKPDVVIVAAYLNDAVVIAKTLYQLAPGTKVIGPAYTFNDAFIKTAGAEVAEGIVALDVAPDVDSKAYAGMADAYRAATKADPTSNPYAVITYDQVITVALAATAAKSADPAKFVPQIRVVSGPPGEKVYTYADGLAALQAGKKIDYQGASSPIDLDETGNIASMNFASFELKGGKLQPTGRIAP